MWSYGSLLLGLDRLGREHLCAAASPADPTLGLRPLGGVASMALSMLLAWLVPLLLTGRPDIVGVVVGVLVLAGGLATFFLSLLRLQRQMAAVKESELAIARELYAEAYEPVRGARGSARTATCCRSTRPLARCGRSRPKRLGRRAYEVVVGGRSLRLARMSGSSSRAVGAIESFRGPASTQKMKPLAGQNFRTPSS